MHAVMCNILYFTSLGQYKYDWIFFPLSEVNQGAKYNLMSIRMSSHITVVGLSIYEVANLLYTCIIIAFESNTKLSG